jgi:hypothetical protein
VGSDVDLHDLAGPGTPHHHVLEPLVGRGGEQRRVVQERHVDAAFVDRVGMHDLVTARR